MMQLQLIGLGYLHMKELQKSKCYLTLFRLGGHIVPPPPTGFFLAVLKRLAVGDETL